MLRKIFGPNRDVVTGQWRKLHNEGLYALYSSLKYYIRVIKSRRMSWTGHLARMEDRRGAYRVLVARPKGWRPLGRSGVDGRILLKRIIKKWNGED